MFKRSLLFIFIFVFSLLFKSEIYSSSASVEDIFSDIWSDYKYLNELQTLYDNGAIKVNSDWKFNPYGLLKRDEFIWIIQKISCKACIQPDTDNFYINKYTSSSFFDVGKNNENFYCIEDALYNGYIKGYDLSYKCDDWTFKDWKSPFCPKNTIILEEALAIVLRISWILTNEEAEKIRQDISDWKITKDLSSDVHPKNSDWLVYSFYPDFMKALDYEIVEYDKNWNKKTYNLIELVNNKLEPKRSITREEFLHIAHSIFKANSCINNKVNNLALKFDILNKSCKNDDINCALSLLDGLEYTYDFKPKVSWDLGSNGLYIWNFYNNKTGEEIIKYGDYLDNFTFPSDWSWLISLTYVDDNWNSAKAQNTLTIWKTLLDQSPLNSYIISSAISWYSPFRLDLEWYSTWWKWKYTYEWDYWDWNIWYWKKTTYIYKEPWTYIITLKVTDEEWNVSESSISIEVLDNENLNTLTGSEIWKTALDADTDSDWINDSLDECPLVYWKLENNWCPIFDISCIDNNWCPSWYDCFFGKSWFWVCTPVTLSNSCDYSGWSFIYWKSICNTCPCNNSLDFLSNLRKCDIIFPAIISTDNKSIYWKWKFFQIK